MGSNVHPKQVSFLAAYAVFGSVHQASRLAKCHRNAHYVWLKTDPGYPALFEDAERRAGDYLEGEMRRRATQGVVRAVRHKGRIVGYQTEFSDTLLALAVKGTKPEKYGTQRIAGADGGALKVDVSGRESLRARIAGIATRLGRADSEPNG